jgi:hypothetical protein
MVRYSSSQLVKRLSGEGSDRSRFAPLPRLHSFMSLGVSSLPDRQFWVVVLELPVSEPRT